MRYERKREEGTAVFYEVLEQGRKAAEFFYAVKPCQTGRGNCQFWIERIHMEQDYLDYSLISKVNAGVSVITVLSELPSSLSESLSESFSK